MTEEIQPHIPFLLYLGTARPTVRTLLLEKATHEELDALFAVILNAVHDQIKVDDHTKKKLMKYGPFLQALLNKDLGREKKRDLCLQFQSALRQLIRAVYQDLLQYG